ncbi:SGS-domain-containing protein [Viridothelium virens]|uniref:SGS-domain-containing protein n=1 Tax=Viridothelium virens TaxID=1048519 RepID=A0A6A6GVF8_VIRVR|nr:SGS-domain-containing protein [Viridothelium virens]
MKKAALGAEALKSGNYPEAIKKYTEALETSPHSPDYYIKRSTAHQRSSPPDNQAALQDAEKGVVYARKRAKRELIAQAQLRRAIALFMLERYRDAQFAFSIVRKLDEKEKTLGIWEKKVGDKLKNLPEDDAKREITISEIPDYEISKKGEIKSSLSGNNSGTGQPDQNKSNVTAPKVDGVQTPADKIKHDWYQNNDNVYFTLLVKGVPKEKAVVDIYSRSLSISFPMPTGSTFDYSLDPLFAEVNASESTFTVMNTKIEVALKKTNQGLKWKSLESNEPLDTEGDLDATSSTTTILHPASSQLSAPAYPTSSKSGAKDWDKIVDSYTKKPSTKTAKPGSDKPRDGSGVGDGDASNSEPDYDDEDDDDVDSNYIPGDEFDEDAGDPANAFFRRLYSGADADTRRAMIKSYQESNGTALSTNWAEVGKGPVETSPPDGMVAKKWGE